MSGCVIVADSLERVLLELAKRVGEVEQSYPLEDLEDKVVELRAILESIHEYAEEGVQNFPALSSKQQKELFLKISKESKVE